MRVRITYTEPIGTPGRRLSDEFDCGGVFMHGPFVVLSPPSPAVWPGTLEGEPILWVPADKVARIEQIDPPGWQGTVVAVDANAPVNAVRVTVDFLAVPAPAEFFDVGQSVTIARFPADAGRA
jgi:hypothetical protein